MNVRHQEQTYLRTVEGTIGAKIKPTGHFRGLIIDVCEIYLLRYEGLQSSSSLGCICCQDPESAPRAPPDHSASYIRYLLAPCLGIVRMDGNVGRVHWD